MCLSDYSAISNKSKWTLLDLLMPECRSGVLIHVITRSLIRHKFGSSRNNDKAVVWLCDLPKPCRLEHKVRPME